MKLTLLGTGCPSIDYKRCGSSNLISTNKTKILVDCGSGVTQRLNESGNSGTSVQIPYFKVIAEDEDMTIKPRIFTNNDMMLQNEYRKVGKNYDHISDFSFYTSALGNSSQTSKSHFFSNTKLDFENVVFQESNLEINLEQVANDTYLKKYKINSPLIKSETLMHSFLKESYFFFLFQKNTESLFYFLLMLMLCIYLNIHNLVKFQKIL